MPTGAPVAVIASRIRTEEKDILAALDSRGVPSVQVDPRRLALPVTGAPPAWRVAVNREISQSRALYAALTLEAVGVPVVNRASAIQTCGDKWRTALAL